MGSGPARAVEDDEDQPPRDSNFRLEVSISVGYNRRRSATSGKLEAGLTTAVLLIAGVIAVFLILHRLSLVQLPF